MLIGVKKSLIRSIDQQEQSFSWSWVNETTYEGNKTPVTPYTVYNANLPSTTGNYVLLGIAYEDTALVSAATFDGNAMDVLVTYSTAAVSAAILGVALSGPTTNPVLNITFANGIQFDDVVRTPFNVDVIDLNLINGFSITDTDSALGNGSTSVSLSALTASDYAYCIASNRTETTSFTSWNQGTQLNDYQSSEANVRSSSNFIENNTGTITVNVAASSIIGLVGISFTDA